MLKTINFYLVTCLSFIILISESCSNNSTVPFPKNMEYGQPMSVPLNFSQASQLRWVPMTLPQKKLIIKKLDLDNLQTTPYETEDFKALGKAPEKDYFNLTDLHTVPLNFDKLKANPIKFITTSLAPPVTIKSIPPEVVTGTSLSMLSVNYQQGISGEVCTAIFKDSNGLIWAATDKGLFRYDGENSELFNLAFNSTISNIAEDNAGRIWYLSQDGLGMLDIQNGTASYSTQIKANNSQWAKFLKDDKGRLWISNTIPLGVVIIDPSLETYKILDSKTGLSRSIDWDTRGIVEDNYKNVWISHDRGSVDIININKSLIRSLGKNNGFINDSVSAETIDNSGKIWLAVGEKELNAIDLEHETITKFEIPITMRKTTQTELMDSEFSSNMASDLLYDNEDRLWIGYKYGIIILDTKTERTKFLIFQTNSAYSSFLIIKTEYK